MKQTLVSRLATIAPLLLASLVVVFVCRTLFIPGYFTTHDGDFHIARSLHFIAELKNGQFPVRMATNAAFGYGYPIFSYFYPLPYYVVAGIHALGIPVVESWKLLLFFATFGSGIAYFNWLKCYFSSWTSLLGTVLFLLAPFTFLNLYVTGQVGATASLFFIPLILLGLARVAKNTASTAGVLLACGVAGLITSHILSVIIALPLIVPYLVVLFIQTKKNTRWRLVTKLATWSLLGVLVSSFYLIPLLLQKNWVRLGLEQSINFRDHWVTLNQLIYSPWGFGYSGVSLQDSLSFQLGLGHWLALTTATLLVVWYWWNWRIQQKTQLLAQKKVPTQQLRHQRMAQVASATLSATWLAIFLTLPWSALLWEHMPLLGYTQYSWRFLAVPALASGWLLAYALEHTGLPKKHQVIAGVAICFLALINTRNYAQTAAPDRYQDHDFASWQGLMHGSTDISWELLPPKASIPLEPSSVLFTDHKSTQASITVLDQSHSGTTTTLAVENQKQQEVIFNRTYYPTWQVLVDGNKQTTYQTENGLVATVVPPGNHTLSVVLTKTPTERILDMISILALMTLLWLGGRRALQRLVS